METRLRCRMTGRLIKLPGKMFWKGDIKPVPNGYMSPLWEHQREWSSKQREYYVMDLGEKKPICLRKFQESINQDCRGWGDTV